MGSDNTRHGIPCGGCVCALPIAASASSLLRDGRGTGAPLLLLRMPHRLPTGWCDRGRGPGRLVSRQAGAGRSALGQHHDVPEPPLLRIARCPRGRGASDCILAHAGSGRSGLPPARHSHAPGCLPGGAQRSHRPGNAHRPGCARRDRRFRRRDGARRPPSLLRLRHDGARLRRARTVSGRARPGASNGDTLHRRRGRASAGPRARGDGRAGGCPRGDWSRRARARARRRGNPGRRPSDRGRLRRLRAGAHGRVGASARGPG